jgi:hypothetical protein
MTPITAIWGQMIAGLAMGTAMPEPKDTSFQHWPLLTALMGVPFLRQIV